MEEKRQSVISPFDSDTLLGLHLSNNHGDGCQSKQRF
jgi:hypothetical protein